jgi:uncharacterized membrane protein SpoIIM required for sporulation
MNTKTLNIENYHIFWACSFVIAFSAVFYIYCVIGTVYNIVDREVSENKSNVLALSIEEKQFDLLSLKNKITLDYAKNLGFIESLDNKYVSAKQSNFAKASLYLDN